MQELKLRYLSKRESRELSEALRKSIGRELTPLAELEAKGFSILVTEEGAILVGSHGAYVPALTDEAGISSLRGQVVVDEGAVRPIVNGANVMRPGIVRYTEFEAGEAVVVREGVYNRPVAVGIALVPSRDLQAMSKGPVVRNVHHLRDEAWEALRSEDVTRLIKKLLK